MLQIINDHHMKSTKLSTDSVVEVDKGKWKVKSEDGKQSYNVMKQCKSCTDASCMLQCQQCNICADMSLCNCPDSFIQNTICKHVHQIQTVLKQKNKENCIFADSLNGWWWKEVCEEWNFSTHKENAKATRKKLCWSNQTATARTFLTIWHWC